MFPFQGTLAVRLVEYNELVSGTKNKFIIYYILNCFVYYILIFLCTRHTEWVSMKIVTED